MAPLSFQDIPRFPHSAYEIDVGFGWLEGHLADAVADGLDIDPPFQRAHVWTKAQNDSTYKGSTLVDGKQRLEAIRRFMRSELPVFGGHALRDIGGHLRLFNGRIKWRVVALASEAELLDLYLAINAGGTPHSAEEIAKVRAMRQRLAP